MGWEQELGAKIQKGRDTAGLSLRALGKLVGISGEGIRNYELGTRVPDADKLAKIGVALGIHEFDLDRVRISIAQPLARTLEPTREQLSFDFSGEYANSRAVIRIRPGGVSVTITGSALRRARR